jgi:hypothetical protein
LRQKDVRAAITVEVADRHLARPDADEQLRGEVKRAVAPPGKCRDEAGGGAVYANRCGAD